jgi:Uma2 family endonuclease
MASDLLSTDPARPSYRFTVDQYHRLYEAGIIPEGVELLRGIITVKGHVRNGHPVPFRFDLNEYHRMIELGILGENEPVELIRGEVVLQMPQGDSHALALEIMIRWLTRLLPDRFAVRCQSPAVFPDSEPEPDFVICQPADVRGRTHPRPEHIVLVIEIAATSLHYDRTVMGRLYAEYGIPVYWIINLEDRQIEVFTDPDSNSSGEPQYRTRTCYSPGEHVELVIAGANLGSIPVDDVLP